MKTNRIWYYDEQELILFNEIKDDNYYRAFRLVQ